MKMVQTIAEPALVMVAAGDDSLFRLISARALHEHMTRVEQQRAQYMEMEQSRAMSTQAATNGPILYNAYANTTTGG